MVQLQRMDACLDTLSDELCQVKTCVDHIARRQTHLGGFVASFSPSWEAFEDEGNDGDSDDDDENEDASSSGDNEMTAWVTCPLSFMTKKGSSFGYESSHVLRDIFVRGIIFAYEGCSEDFL